MDDKEIQPNIDEIKTDSKLRWYYLGISLALGVGISIATNNTSSLDRSYSVYTAGRALFTLFNLSSATITGIKAFYYSRLEKYSAFSESYSAKRKNAIANSLIFLASSVPTAFNNNYL